MLLMRKWMGLFLRKTHLLRCWGWISFLNWIGALTLSLSLKEPWFVLWSFFLLRLLCTSTNLLYSHGWNAAVMSGLTPGLSILKMFWKLKGVGLTGSQFWQGSSGWEKVTFFSRSCSIFIKNKLKSEIFNGKKLYKQNVFLCHKWEFKLGNFS